MKISEHFQKAKEDGYPWAQAAIDNFERRTSFGDDVDIETLDSAVLTGFNWRMTPQGVDYWDTVWRELLMNKK